MFFSTWANADSDPTKPFGTRGNSNVGGVTVENKKLILESIIHGDGVHTVVINGELLKVGQYIGEFKLVAVNDKSVVLRSEEERKKLFIFSELIVK